MKAACILLFLCLITGWTHPAEAGLKVQAEESIAGGVVLISAEFGLFEEEADGTTKITVTDKIPLKEGQVYGWRLKLRGLTDEVDLREELELPVAPKSWESPAEGDGFKVSPDGRTGITEVTAEVKDGTLMNAWKIAPGDPAGDHVLRIFLKGKLVRTFKFKVIAAP